MAHTVVADSGYGSEENYRFMSENGMEAYVKYNYFHMEQRPRFKPDPFRTKTSTTMKNKTFVSAHGTARCKG